MLLGLLFIRARPVYVSHGSALPETRSCAEACEPLAVSFIVCPIGLGEAAPVGCPAVFEIDVLSGIDDVLEVAVLGLEEVNPFPFVDWECDRCM